MHLTFRLLLSNWHWVYALSKKPFEMAAIKRKPKQTIKPLALQTLIIASSNDYTLFHVISLRCPFCAAKTTTMKTSLSIFSALMVFFIKTTFAQSPNTSNALTVNQAFSPKFPLKIDTLYYPFYNGVQMIEIDHIGYWDKKIFFLEQSRPRAIPHSAFNPMPIGNEYFFRHTSGNIVKAYNTKHSLTELNQHFKKIPIKKQSRGLQALNLHSQQHNRKGIWYQSPQANFHFSGHYKVSTGYAEQTSVPNARATELKFGLIDSLGQIVIPIQYHEILPYYDNLLIQKAYTWGIINYQNETVVNPVYEHHEIDHYAFNVPHQLASVFFMNQNGNENQGPTYTYKAVFVAQKNRLIELNNYDKVEHEYAWTAKEDANKRYIPVFKNHRTGFLNEHYQEIVAPQYEIFEFSRNTSGLFRVAKAGKFGFYNRYFQPVIPLEYDYAESFLNDSTALVLKNGTFYRINTKNTKQTGGNLKPNWQMGYLSFIADKHLVDVQTKNFHGLIDTSSNQLIFPFVYHKLLAPIKITAFLNKNKAFLEQQNIQAASQVDVTAELLFHQNKIVLKNLNNLYGVVDTNFKLLIDFKYEDLQPIPYRLDYLLYKQNGKLGAMNYNGQNVLEDDYENVRYNSHYVQERDVFKVKKNGKWGVLNFQNEVLLPFEYDSITFLGHWNRPKKKWWVVQKDDKFGVVGVNNEVLVPFEYPGISHLEGDNLWIIGENKVRYKVVLKDPNN